MAKNDIVFVVQKNFPHSSVFSLSRLVTFKITVTTIRMKNSPDEV